MDGRVIEAFGQAQTSSDFNRARLALQRFGTPAEVRAVAALRTTLPRDVLAWVERLDEYCHWEQPQTSDFVREDGWDDWVLYLRAAQGPRAELLVGFAGAAGNLFQPTPVVLQHIPPNITALLLLHDAKRQGFAAGAGAATGLGDLALRIAAVAAEYSSVITLGTSSGGQAAIHLADPIGARRAVSIGGRCSRDLPALPDAADAQAHPFCAFGALNQRDRDGALSLALRYPASIATAVPGIARHNVQHAAFQGGRLTALFHSLLGESDLPLIAAPRLGSEAATLDIREHDFAAAPVWAREDVSRPPSSLPGRGRSWTAQSTLWWRAVSALAGRIPISDSVASRVERSIAARFGVRIRFRRRRPR